MIFSLTPSSVVREMNPILRIDLTRLVGVAPQHALEELRDALAHLRAELRHRAEVEEHDRPVLPDEHVPGVRIGVVDAVDEDHLAVEAHEADGHVLPVHAERAQGGEVARLHALDERRHEHALACRARGRARERRRAGRPSKFFAMRSM